MTFFTSSLKLKLCMNLSEELKKICPLKSYKRALPSNELITCISFSSLLAKKSAESSTPVNTPNARL